MIEPRTPPPRAARDTLDEVRDVARDLRSLDERVKGRLDSGAESFTRLDERVRQAELTARAANEMALRASAPKPIPWVRVVPIILTLLAGFAAVVSTMARTPSRSDVEARATALEGELGLLQSKLVALQIELSSTRAALDSIREVALRRLEVIERAALPRKTGK